MKTMILDGVEAPIPMGLFDPVIETSYQTSAAGVQAPIVWEYVLGDDNTLLTTQVKFTTRARHGLNVRDVRISLTNASINGAVEVDIQVNNISILSTRVTIDANQLSSVTAQNGYILEKSSISDDDQITICVRSAGTQATGLKAAIIGTLPQDPFPT